MKTLPHYSKNIGGVEMKRIIAIVLIVLICFIAGGLMFVVFTGSDSAKATEETKDVAAKEHATEFKDSVVYCPAPSIITNIKNSSRYLKIKVSLEIKNEKLKEHFAKNEFKIKDIIINVLRNKTESELISPDSQESLKVNIKEALGAKMDINDLIDIYIDDFVIQ